MNRAFMREYYDLRYDETLMPTIMKSNEECRRLHKEIMGLEGQIESFMRSIGDECLSVHRRLFVAKGDFDALIMRQAYLQGARDRERMLE